MLDILRRKSDRDQRKNRQREVIPDAMGYPRSGFSRYDPFGEERWGPDRRSFHTLEGAGRKGWDYDQNRGYGQVYGNATVAQKPSRNFRGKGPRNYQRSDERILEDIYDRISGAWSLDASEVEIEVRNGVVQMSGRVADRSVRHRLEDIAEGILGVMSIENRISIQ